MYELLYLMSLGWGVWLILWWLIAAIVVAVVASNKGRSAVGYFLLALFLSPVFAGLMLAAATDTTLAEEVSGRQAKDFREGIDSLWKQLEAIRVQLASMQTGVEVASPALPRGSVPELYAAPRPLVAAGMGYCPGCQRLRGLGSPKCIYCGSTEAARETK